MWTTTLHPGDGIHVQSSGDEKQKLTSSQSTTSVGKRSELDTPPYNQRQVSTASVSTILRSFMGVLNGRLSEFSQFEHGMARDAHGM